MLAAAECADDGAFEESTAPGAPWENAITTCLSVLCRNPAVTAPEPDVQSLFSHVHRLVVTPGLEVFHTYLCLAVIDAAGGARHPGTRAIANAAIDCAVQSQDGYSAGELLAHPDYAVLLTEAEGRTLLDILHTSGLDNSPQRGPFVSQLSAAVDLSEKEIIRNFQIQDRILSGRITVRTPPTER